MPNTTEPLFDYFSAWPLESFHTGIGSDFTCCTLELFRTIECIYIRATFALHHLRSWTFVRQLSDPFTLHFEHFGEIFQGQCDISMHTKSIAATIHRLRGTLHCTHGHREFLSFLENWQTSVARWLRTRIRSHFNAWQSKARNWLQSHDTWIDLGRIYGTKNVSFWISFQCSNGVFMSLQELLGYSLPLINYHYVRRKFRSAIRYAMGSYTTTDQSERLRPQLTINTKCEYCNERPTLPHHMGCKHIFCYYCLRVSKSLAQFVQNECRRFDWKIIFRYREICLPMPNLNVPPAAGTVATSKLFDLHLCAVEICRK